MITQQIHISDPPVLVELLEKRRAEKNLRTLKDKSGLIDFCSNDYLGFSRSALLRDKIVRALEQQQFFPIGATGSRLISGNHPLFEALEKKLAVFHQAPAALIFNSGYDANAGFFASVPQYHDRIVYDEMVHASVYDGIKMSRAEAVAFRHNDLDDLKQKLQGNYANFYVAVESVYSMDGSFADLEELAKICHATNARLVVDEAHATGLFGPQGEGRVVETGTQQYCYARLYTFGKALGCQGALLAGTETLKQFLINYARPFVFSTALPYLTLIAIQCAYDLLPSQSAKREKIKGLARRLQQGLKAFKTARLCFSPGPIQSIIIPGNENALRISAGLEKAGFYAKAILYPTVPRGEERIRLCMHSFNTEEEIDHLAEAFNQLVE
ncbi:MAG: 8-amino-7-oxononanoate synthase [Chitinophagales bacterium]|nr:MAG: 8-amino-7-oxononanoate synthase [Chitinophagales bacterium]